MGESWEAMKLKLFIDKKKKKVIFAEAEKRLVCTISCLINLPFSTVTTFLEGNKKNSFKNLDRSLNEDLAVKTSSARCPLQNYGSLSELASSIVPQAMFHTYHLPYRGSAPPYVPHDDDGDCGYGDEAALVVKPCSKYMLLDDLQIDHLSTSSFIALLHHYNIHDLSLLEERLVDFGMDEVMKLLTTSLKSKTVLTDLFLNATAPSDGDAKVVNEDGLDQYQLI